MLAIPIGRKLDRKNFPYLTLLLIFINCLVFIVAQRHDDEALRRAFEQYFQSKLPNLELPAYVDYLQEQGELEKANKMERILRVSKDLRDDGNEDDDSHSADQAPDAAESNAPDLRVYVLFEMLHDAGFVQRLEHNQVVKPADPQFAQWREQRTQFDALLQKNTAEHYGFKPAVHEPITFITHMFLHGGIDHLIGNMVFLLLIGFLVEEVLGRWLFPVLYLLGGLAAVGLFWMLRPDSGVPLVGASGAIAGLMGMYTVLFGLRKITFFYWVLVYFDYFKAPAIALLPFWVGKELVELYWGGPSQVAYQAHIGGLLGGAVLAGLFRLAFRPRLEAIFAAEDRAKDHSADFQRAVDLAGKLEFDRAAGLFERLLEHAPGDRKLITHLYNVAKHKPESERYHHAATRILDLPEQDEGTHELVHETYREYTQLAKPGPRLREAQIATLARRFAVAGHTEDAERLVHFLLKKSPGSPALPETMIELAKAFFRRRNQHKYRQYLGLVERLFQGTKAAEAAAELARHRV
jgi:membrane associated rhomboid family serine protease